MREIKFRGFNKGTKKWYYGFFTRTEYTGDYWIDGRTSGIVEEDSIGQYTGLKDKNGVEIYEGDLVKFGALTHKVIWNEERASFVLMFEKKSFYMSDMDREKYNVVGNIYEEKLKEEK